MLTALCDSKGSLLMESIRAPLMNVLKAQHTMQCLTYGAQRVYSPSPAVTREESTFDLEVAIRGGLLRVNITDKRDKKKERKKKKGATKLAGGVKGHHHRVAHSALSFLGHITGGGSALTHSVQQVAANSVVIFL